MTENETPTDEEIARRRDNAIRRALSTPAPERKAPAKKTAQRPKDAKTRRAKPKGAEAS